LTAKVQPNAVVGKIDLASPAETCAAFGPGEAESKSLHTAMPRDPVGLGELGQSAYSHLRQCFLLDPSLGRTLTLFLNRT
jgi:hypothetical protein